MKRGQCERTILHNPISSRWRHSVRGVALLLSTYFSRLTRHEVVGRKDRDYAGIRLIMYYNSCDIQVWRDPEVTHKLIIYIYTMYM